MSIVSAGIRACSPLRHTRPRSRRRRRSAAPSRRAAARGWCAPAPAPRGGRSRSCPRGAGHGAHGLCRERSWHPRRHGTEGCQRELGWLWTSRFREATRLEGRDMNRASKYFCSLTAWRIYRSGMPEAKPLLFTLRRELHQEIWN